MKALIQGIGVVGGFGCGCASLAGAIINQNPSGPLAGVREPDEPEAAMPALTADTALLAQVVSPKVLRRVDHHSRMALLASHLALEDAGLAGGLPGTLGVIVATGMGPTAGTLDTQSPDAEPEELRLSPIQFSNSVHNAAAAYISMLLKIRGPNLSISQYDLSVPLAVQTALDWLEEGRAATVLVGGVDCCSRTSPAAFPDAFPESQHRPGGNRGRGRLPAVGEGSAFFVLTRPAAEIPRYPVVHGVWIGEPSWPPPAGRTLHLHGGSGEEDELLGPDGFQAVFTHLYGAFPTGMALDLAVAALLLEKGNERADLLSRAGSAPGFREITRIRCLKKGVGGECGMIEVGQ